MIYGESASTTVDPLQHFVLNLYFDNNATAPGLSGLVGAGCPSVCAAGHPNGFDLFGNSGAPEAGTLAFESGADTSSN